MLGNWESPTFWSSRIPMAFSRQQVCLNLTKAFGLSHFEDTIYLGTLLGSLGSHTFQSSQVS